MTHSAAPDAGRGANLRFVFAGSKRALAILACLAIIGALSEAFLLGSIVQAVASLSAGESVVHLSLGPRTISTSAEALLGAAVLAAVIRAAVVGAVSLAAPRIAAASRLRHRRRLLESYMSADWPTQASDRSGKLLQTFSSSVNEANTVVMLVAQSLPALITLVVLILVALAVNPVVTVCLLLLGLAIGLTLRPLSRVARGEAHTDARERNATASHVAGVLPAAAEVSVLGSRAGVLEVGNERIAAAERAFGRAVGLKRLVSATGQSLAFIIAAVSLYLLVVSGSDVDFAAVGTIAVLLIRGASLAQQVQAASSHYGSVAPFIQQVRTQIEQYEARRQEFGSSSFPSNHEIVLDAVAYTYPGSRQPALQATSARIPAGTSVAVVGPSGAGKSTLMQLMLRLRPPTVGRLTIGGVPLSSISDDGFSANVAYVPQTPHLIPGTVSDNIRFFRMDLPPERIVDAARRAYIHDEIVAMADGYDTRLEGHVDMLSGGQKQRLALARALARGPLVLVLDEPTSALDGRSERAILNTLKELQGRTTVIVVTHRPETASQFDGVLEIDRDRPPSFRWRSSDDTHDHQAPVSVEDR